MVSRYRETKTIIKKGLGMEQTGFMLRKPVLVSQNEFYSAKIASNMRFDKKGQTQTPCCLDT